VPEELHRRLKVKAAVEGVNMADLVRAWITEKCAS
jgi:plasmid stability protein